MKYDKIFQDSWKQKLNFSVIQIFLFLQDIKNLMLKHLVLYFHILLLLNLL